MSVMLNVLPKPEATCAACVGRGWSQHGDMQGFVPASDTGRNGVLVVLEAAGEDEEGQGIPTVGRAGYYLWQQLLKAGLQREDFRVHNVLSCRPPKNWLAKAPWEFDAIASCAPNLAATVSDMRDRCAAADKDLTILALGRIAFRTVMGLDVRSPIMQEDYQGYVHWSDTHRCWVVAADHPSYLMQGNHHLVPTLQFAAQRAIEVAAGGFRYDTPAYLCDPPVPVFAEWVAAYRRRLDAAPADTFLSFDIETPLKLKKKDAALAREDDEDYIILRCSFSYEPGHAVSIPWQAEYMAVLEDLFGDPRNNYVTWNGNYDIPRVKVQMPVRGTNHDAMLAWHVLNSQLDKRLGFVTPFYAKGARVWKHLSHAQPALYNCLLAETRLVRWDGTRVAINDVVRNREAAVLRGMDEAGHAVPVTVVGWHRQVVRGQQWLKIKTAGTRQPIYCTPDHKIWVPCRGWVEAHALKPGDAISSSHFGHPSLIHGTLLGDATVDKRGRLGIVHGIKQAEWFAIKHRNLDGTKPTQFVGGYGTSCIGADAWVPETWRSQFYPHGKKIFIAPPTAAALAVWYCDDGCLSGGKIPRLAVYFANNPEVFAWLRQEFGRVSEYNKTSKGSVAACLDTAAFFGRIAPYVPPCMQYKLPVGYRGQYNGWLDTPTPQETTVLSVQPFIVANPRTNRGLANTRYCVTVDHPTHRFMTDGGLVKNCQDSDMALTNYLGIRADLDRAGQWHVFERHVIRLNTVLDAMSAAGVCRDEDARAAAEVKLSGLLQDVEQRMQEVVPQEARRLQVYKKTPRDTAGMVQVTRPLATKRCSHCGLTTPGAGHVKPWTKKRTAAEGHPNPCAGASIHTAMLDTPLWAKVLPFKTSGVQLQAYQKQLRHQAIVNRKEGRITFDEDAVKRLMKQYPKDPLYPLIGQHHESQRLLTTYIGVTMPGGGLRGGLRTGRDGKIHAEFSHNPETLRLACQNPNMQNLPHITNDPNNLQNMVRGTIIASPGCILLERDFSGIEAVLSAYEARWRDGVRLAKLGMHSFLASHVLERPADPAWSDSDLAAYLMQIKRDKDPRVQMIYQGCKRAIHLSNYGGTPRKMVQAEPETFPTLKYAEKLQGMYFELAAPIRKWQIATQLEAHSQGHLRNAFGYILRFTHVFRNVKEGGQWVRKPGDQANDALAFKPQSTAAGIIKEAMLRLYFDRGCPWMRLQVHDSLVLDVPLDIVEEVDAVLREEMERPVQELPIPASWNMGTSLVIDTEMKRGQRWSM